MDFVAVVDQVIALLRQRGRMTYRTLQRQFELDDGALHDLKEELLYAHPEVRDDEGRGLVWTGDAGTAPAVPAAPVENPGQAPLTYTPPYLAEKILTSRSALEGERKQVTVLFADLKGSMELLADRDPEEARRLLDPVLERMMAAVHRYEGTVNQVMGDGIMALFGAPLAHEDHAVRACYAALAMQAAVKQYATEVQRTHGVPIHMRVGLNAGEVVVRSIGSDLHMDYTAVGQTTHLAARMEQMAMPGVILITPAVLGLVEGFVQVKALGAMPVKGLRDPVEVYEVTGAGMVRSRLQAAAARGLTRFVGRDPELEQLRRAQQLAGTGHGQVAAIVGEAGVGKSRLVYELIHSHRLQGWLVLESASVSYGKATSYLPVIDLLKGYFKIHDRDDLRETREKVTGKLLTLDESLKPALAALLALLDVPVEDAAWRTLDPGQRRQQTLDAVTRLLLREAREQPLLLIFEDLHWIDSETQALLDALVESLGSARLLLLVNYRPEYQHPWGSKTYYGPMRLDALPPESAGEILSALLGDDPGLEPLKRLLVRRGNPFFIEESIRTLVETGALTGERGAYRLARPIQAIEVPATVQVILAARIDRLPADDKQLLQTASVIGKDVPFVLLHAVAEAAADAVHRGLTHLQAAEFLYETRLFPDPEYTFKHALTHEVTYGTLLQDRRKTLHAWIVGAIERCYPDRLTEHVERLAHHAVGGEVWEQAVDYSRQAAARATDRSAYDQAVAHTDRALEALARLPKSRQTLELAVTIRTDSGRYAGLFSTGQRERLLADIGEALTLAERLGDQRLLALTTNYFANALWFSGQNVRALEFCQRASRMAAALGDTAIQVVSNLDLGMILDSLGDYRSATAFLEKNVGILHGDVARDRFGRALYPSVTTRSWLAVCLAELGEFRKAIAVAGECLRIAEDLGQPGSMLLDQQRASEVSIRRGEFRDAIPGLERCLSLASTGAFAFLYPGLAGWLGHAYAMTGRQGEALPLLEQAAERSGRGNRIFEALATAHLGEAYLLAGRPHEAQITAERALSLSRERGERGVEARTLHVLGKIAAHDVRPSDAEAAERRYRGAFALAEELGMRPLVAHCHRGLGTLYATIGQREQARTALTTAIEMYRSMEMTFWLPETEAALAQVKEG